MKKIDSELQEVKTVAISGHVRPDGDCIGSCLGMYHYLTENFPHLERVTVYLEETQQNFSIVPGIDKVVHTCTEDVVYDLFLALDSSDKERLGEAVRYFDTAGKTICYDHHISNKGFAMENYVAADMSSASELVFYAMEPDKISKITAGCLYMGIAHDSGIFQYSSTSPETMETAAFLMRKGINHNEIIDFTYVQKSHTQNVLMAKAILESRLLFDGKCIVSGFSKETLDQFGVNHSELGGIVSQLRSTIGVEAAVFLDETAKDEYKVSMRSKSYVDVSKIAVLFGGGGHVRAAGCSMKGTFDEVTDRITREIEKQITDREVKVL